MRLRGGWLVGVVVAAALGGACGPNYKQLHRNMRRWNASDADYLAYARGGPSRAWDALEVLLRYRPGGCTQTRLAEQLFTLGAAPRARNLARSTSAARLLADVGARVGSPINLPPGYTARGPRWSHRRRTNPAGPCSIEMFQLLVRHGMHHHRANAYAYYSLQHPQVIRTLLQQGADPKHMSQTFPYRCNERQCAGTYVRVAALLDAGILPLRHNPQDPALPRQHVTMALEALVRFGDVERLRALGKLLPSAAANRSWLLERAYKQRLGDRVKLISVLFELGIKTDTSRLLTKAIRDGADDVAQLLLRHTSDKRALADALAAATKANNTVWVERLTDAGAASHDKLRRTELAAKLAANTPMTLSDVDRAMSLRPFGAAEEAILLQVARRAPLTQRERRIPLRDFRSKRRRSLIKDARAMANGESTYLHRLMRYATIDDVLVRQLKVLLDAGASVNARDQGQRTPLDLLYARPSSRARDALAALMRQRGGTSTPHAELSRWLARAQDDLCRYQRWCILRRRHRASSGDGGSGYSGGGYSGTTGRRANVSRSNSTNRRPSHTGTPTSANPNTPPRASGGNQVHVFVAPIHRVRRPRGDYSCHNAMGAQNAFRDMLRERFKSIYNRSAIGGTPSPTCWGYGDRKKAQLKYDELVDRREPTGWIKHTVNTGFYMRVGRSKCSYNTVQYYVCKALVRAR